MADYDHRWERNWRRMEAMARRGFQQFGNLNMNLNPDWGRFGGNFRIGRMLASGDLKLVALYFIEQQPRHGYDLIKAVEEKSAGFYSPSPGIVYPALTYLEEAGFVTSAADGNKKLYTITDEGRTHLADNREAIESTLNFLGKAGARMQEWRDRMQSGTWPFAGSEDETGSTADSESWSFDGRHGYRRGREETSRHAGAEPDDIAPEVRDARKALKKAVREAVGRGPAEQQRIARILARAANEIRNGSRAATDDQD